MLCRHDICKYFSAHRTKHNFVFSFRCVLCIFLLKSVPIHVEINISKLHLNFRLLPLPWCSGQTLRAVKCEIYPSGGLWATFYVTSLSHCAHETRRCAWNSCHPETAARGLVVASSLLLLCFLFLLSVHGSVGARASGVTSNTSKNVLFPPALKMCFSGASSSEQTCYSCNSVSFQQLWHWNGAVGEALWKEDCSSVAVWLV